MATMMERYQQAKRSISQQLQILMSLSYHYKEEALYQQLRQMKETLDKEDFEVVVAGEFSSGKSTFLNALLQERLLPSGVTPTTTVLSRIEYADEESYQLVMMDGKEKIISAEQFQQFTANQMDDQQGTIERIRHVTIGYPTVFCKDDIVLIDSPGTNDTSIVREEITNTFIPQSDAVILLMHAEQILPESTMHFLQRILSEDIRKIFFVINFKDTVDPSAYDEIFNYAKERIEQVVPGPMIHLISAKAALDHYKPLPKKEETNSARTKRRRRRRRQQALSLEESGLPQLSEDLLRFLASTSGKDRLVRVLHQMLKVARELESEYIHYQLRLYDESGRAAQMNESEAREELDLLKKERIVIPQRASRMMQAHLDWVRRESRRHLLSMEEQLGNTFFQRRNELSMEELQNVLQSQLDPLEGAMMEHIHRYITDVALPQIEKNFQGFIEQDHHVRQALRMPAVEVRMIEAMEEGFTLEDGLFIGAVVGVTSLVTPTLGLLIGAVLGIGATHKEEEEVPQAGSFELPIEQTVRRIEHKVHHHLESVIDLYITEMKRRIEAHEKSIERHLESLEKDETERREKEKELRSNEKVLAQLIQAIEQSYQTIEKTL